MAGTEHLYAIKTFKNLSGNSPFPESFYAKLWDLHILALPFPNLSTRNLNFLSNFQNSISWSIIYWIFRLQTFKLSCWNFGVFSICFSNSKCFDSKLSKSNRWLTILVECFDSKLGNLNYLALPVLNLSYRTFKTQSGDSPSPECFDSKLSNFRIETWGSSLIGSSIFESFDSKHSNFCIDTLGS